MKLCEKLQTETRSLLDLNITLLALDSVQLLIAKSQKRVRLLCMPVKELLLSKSASVECSRNSTRLLFARLTFIYVELVSLASASDSSNVRRFPPQQSLT